MVSLGVVWGHWRLQSQGKWQYLQNTCASFYLHTLSFKTQPPWTKPEILDPPIAKQSVPKYLKSVSFVCILSADSQTQRCYNIDRLSSCFCFFGVRCVWLAS